MERFVTPTLLATGIWHSLASYFFMCKPRGIMKMFLEKQPTTQELQLTSTAIRFLGGINVGYALLAFFTLFHYLVKNQIRKSNLIILGVANFSQFFFDTIGHRDKIFNTSFLLKITIPDAIFAIINFLLAYKLFTEQKSPRIILTNPISNS